MIRTEKAEIGGRGKDGETSPEEQIMEEPAAGLQYEAAFGEEVSHVLCHQKED